MQTVNKKLPAGSNWVIEVGHNGNGNVEVCFPTSTLELRLTGYSKLLRPREAQQLARQDLVSILNF
jgi:hypothetical protein